MESIGWVISKLFKIPFLALIFIIYLPINILDVLWNIIVEEKPVPVKVISR